MGVLLVYSNTVFSAGDDPVGGAGCVSFAQRSRPGNHVRRSRTVCPRSVLIASSRSGCFPTSRRARADASFTLSLLSVSALLKTPFESSVKQESSRARWKRSRFCGLPQTFQKDSALDDLDETDTRGIRTKSEVKAWRLRYRDRISPIAPFVGRLKSFERRKYCASDSGRNGRGKRVADLPICCRFPPGKLPIIWKTLDARDHTNGKLRNAMPRESWPKVRYLLFRFRRHGAATIVLWRV